jgi:hypothetical protein
MDKRTDISRNGCSQTLGTYMSMFVLKFFSISIQAQGQIFAKHL